MLSKIYLAFLGLSIAAMAFFTYYSWSWLQSIGAPTAAVEGYEYHTYLSCIYLAVSGVVSLMLANGVMWATQRAWALWTTFAYAAIFIIVKYFWLGEAFFRYKKTNGMFDGSFSLGPVMGAILVVVAGAVVFANQFASARLYQKMYPPAEIEAQPDPKQEAETPPE